ncbi:MAG: hypothetical protein QG673_1410 [Pseudomonadota bacterium]|nr:hypothetical protein [Pseudomonadota bacterium]
MTVTSSSNSNSVKKFKYPDIKFDDKLRDTPTSVMQTLFNPNPSQVQPNENEDSLMDDASASNSLEINFSTNGTMKKSYLNAIIGAMNHIDQKVKNAKASQGFQNPAEPTAKQAILANALMDGVDDLIKNSNSKLWPWQVAKYLQEGCEYLLRHESANQVESDPEFKNNMLMYSSFFATIKELAIIRSDIRAKNMDQKMKFDKSHFNGENEQITKLQETVRSYFSDDDYKKFEPSNARGMRMKNFVGDLITGSFVGVVGFSYASVAGALALSAVLSIVFPPTLAIVITAGLAMSLFKVLGTSIRKVINYRHAVMLEDLINNPKLPPTGTTMRQINPELPRSNTTATETD